MDKRVYKDLSIASGKFFLQFSGAWFAKNDAEEFRRKISLSYVAFTAVYCTYANLVNMFYYWTRDLSYSIYCCCNVLCVILAVVKVIIVRIRRFELADVVNYAERHFWHYNYDPEEWLHFAECQKHCRWFTYFTFTIPVSVLFGYMGGPIASNITHNKTERILLYEIQTDFPVKDTPYYELILTFQAIVLFVLFIAYISPDTFLCVLIMHVISQFRMIQLRMLRLWNSDKDTDADDYSARCSAELKKCIRQHQSLIAFCEKLEHVFTHAVLLHMVVFSLLMGLDCYEILLTAGNVSRRLQYVGHVMGSFIHLAAFSYFCHGIIEESTNVTTTMYFGSWNNLPMDKIGRSVRSDVKMIMTRGLKPCQLTAGGFFPVSLETFTTLASSTFSYFTLMRESFMKNDDE